MFRKLLEMTYHNWTAKILSLIAAVFLFSFNRMNTLEEYKIIIPINLYLPGNFAVSSPYNKTATLKIRGDKKLNIKELSKDDFVVKADLSIYPNIGRSDKTIYASLHYEKRGNALNKEPLDISMSPATVAIKLEKRVEKVVKVVPKLTGTLTEGFVLVNYTITPQEIVISGAESRVRLIESVETEPVNLDTRKKDFYLNINTVMPDELLSRVNPTLIEFIGVVSQMFTEKEITNVPIDVIKTASNLKAEKIAVSGTLKVKIPDFILKKVETANFRIIVDASNIVRPGKYNLKTEAELTEGVILADFSPKEIVVDFSYGF